MVNVKTLAVLVLIAIVLIAGFFLSSSAPTDGSEAATDAVVGGKKALVYNGDYADPASAQSISDLLEKAGFEIQYFSDPTALNGQLAGARLLVIGGTVDFIEPFVESFPIETTRAIKDFIDEGGLYLGVCGGAYIASSGWDESSHSVTALGLVPIKTDTVYTDPAPRVVTVFWKGIPRPIYYQYGPKFLPEQDGGYVVARYGDDSIAALYQSVGKGRVYLIGPHPEADISWIESNVIDGEKWTSTDDLARDMIADLAGNSD